MCGQTFSLQQSGSYVSLMIFTAGVHQTVELGEIEGGIGGRIGRQHTGCLAQRGRQNTSGFVGRTFDLKSAYKQFGVDLEH